MQASNLPAIITRASSRLLSARDSAEVLEAKNMAEAALHYAKVTKAANETHADCLRIITRAEMRMANEIDRGQASGQVATPQSTLKAGAVPVVRAADNGKSTYEELGVTRQRVSEWRKIRDAGEEKVEQAISGALKEGRAPTKSDIRRVVLDPEFQAEAEAAARDIEIERDERIALGGAEELAAENEKLANQVAGLSRRIAALIDENGTLKYREKMWRERAVAAGWKGRADA
jgi:hypothetical protein